MFKQKNEPLFVKTQSLLKSKLGKTALTFDL